MDWQDFEGAGDVCLCQPGASASKTDEVYGMGDSGVVHREIWAGNEAVDAWGGGAVG